MHSQAKQIIAFLIAAGMGWLGWAGFADAVDALSRRALPKVLFLSSKAEFYAQLTFSMLFGLLPLTSAYGASGTFKLKMGNFRWSTFLGGLVIGFTVFLITALIIKSRSRGALSFTGEMLDLLKDNKSYILFNPLNLSLLAGNGAALGFGLFQSARSAIAPKKSKPRPRKRKK